MAMTSLAHNPPLVSTSLTGAPELVQLEPAGLLARLRSGDQAALAQITRQYGRALTRAAYLHLGDAHAAEDAVQEAMIAAWDGAHRTSEETPLWPWLLGIAFNHCRKHLRSLSRRRRREQQAHELRLIHTNDVHSPGAAALAADETKNRLDALRHALGQLTEPLRCVVILRYEQGLSVADTATALNVPQGTVKRRCHEAIGQLRQLMRETP